MSGLNGTPVRYADVAMALLDVGLEPIPLRGKRPVVSNWSNIEVNQNQVRRWCRTQRAAAVGVRLGRAGDLEGLYMVDVDVTHPQLAERMEAVAREVLGAGALFRYGARPKFAVPVRMPGGPWRKQSSAWVVDPVLEDKHRVEVLGLGQQAAVFGVHPDTGQPYQWVPGGNGGEVEGQPLTEEVLGQLPILGSAGVAELFERFEREARALGLEPGTGARVDQAGGGEESNDTWLLHLHPPQGVGEDEARADLEVLGREVLEDHDTWLRIGMGLHHEFGDAGLDLWDECSQRAGNYPSEGRAELERRWRSFGRGGGRPVTYSTVRRMAQEARERARGPVRAGEPAPERVGAGALRKTLDMNQDGKLYKSLGNLGAILRRWNGLEQLRFNEWSGRLLVGDRPVEETDYTQVREAIESGFRLLWGKADVADMMHQVAREASFNPLRDYLEALAWDGKPRLDTWLVDYCGAADNHYTREVGAMHLVAAVARVLTPGVKYDHMLILEGPQGCGKSSTIRALVPEEHLFSDAYLNFSKPKEAYEVIQGVWLYEVSELAGMGPAKTEHVKAFVSAQVDRYRGAYARDVADFPRRMVLFGSVNEAQYLKDTTGNRRFLPVACGSMRPQDVARDRNQLWAEAVARFRGGADLHLSLRATRAALEEQEDRMAEDPWERVLEAFLERLEPEDEAPTTNELLRECGVPAERHGGRHSARVGQLMSRLGWHNRRVDAVRGPDGKRRQERRWFQG